MGYINHITHNMKQYEYVEHRRNIVSYVSRQDGGWRCRTQCWIVFDNYNDDENGFNNVNEIISHSKKK